MVVRERISDAQARCVSRYVFAAYDAQQIAVIETKGITALASPFWAEYGHAFLACTLYDEVVRAGRTGLSTVPPTSAHA